MSYTLGEDPLKSVVRCVDFSPQRQHGGDMSLILMVMFLIAFCMGCIAVVVYTIVEVVIYWPMPTITLAILGMSICVGIYYFTLWKSERQRTSSTGTNSGDSSSASRENAARGAGPGEGGKLVATDGRRKVRPPPVLLRVRRVRYTRGYRGDA